MSIALGLLAAAVVYVSYYPSDSVAVEKGDALWFGAGTIVIATIAWSAHVWTVSKPPSAGSGLTTAGRDRGGPAAKSLSGKPLTLPLSPAARGEREQSDPLRGQALGFRIGSKSASWALDIFPWLLAAWMMLAAFASSPPGNLRMATNEAWLWVSAAAVFTSTRRLVSGLRTRQAMLVLVVVCGTGLAVHGLHQYLISLPANRAEYQRDPEQVLRLAGVDAPPDSAERIVFENRLFDGGPTGTFALANSLAAVLLAVVVISLGVLRFHWRDLRAEHRAAWAIVTLVCLSCLIATRSRSALLAMLIGAGLMLVASSRARGRNPKTLVLGLAGMLLMSTLIAVFIALFGSREWFEEAPASLAFRLQYWRSTWQMVLDQPLFGAGPGNFQSIYERYREASASEQVAEPHNLFFETLAAGGFLGLGLLVLAIVAGFLVIAFRGDPSSDDMDQAADQPASWLWLGAVLAVGMVWLIGWASRHTPDVQASLFVVPASVVAAVLLWPSVAGLTSRDLDSILAIMLVAITVHLMVSGGWTVPGVAMIVWVGSATLVRIDGNVGESVRGNRWASAAIVGSGLMTLAALDTMSLRPVESQQRLMATAAMAQESGSLDKAQVTLRRAAQADPWSPDAVLWLADFHRWQIILQSNPPTVHRQWEARLSEAKRRGGDDPAVYQMIGAQQLHVYQRHGEAGDLAAAAETFRKATQWSPSNQWMMAQMAVVAAAQGNTEEARRLARRATELSHLSVNIERALSKQLVYVARPLGSAANRGPIRRRADELLREPNAEDSRTGGDRRLAD